MDSLQHRLRLGTIRCSFLLVLLLAVASHALAQDPAADGEIPPGKPRYLGREIAQTMHFEGAPWLMRDSRQREEDCETLLKALKIEPGQTVCDMGCGNGFYTLPLARLVGERGQILGVDIQPEMLHMLEARASEAGLTNIKPVSGTQVDPQLEPESVDLILLVDVYHEFSHPVEMLAAMRKALKPGGRIALAEFRLEDRNVPIKRLHKMSKKQILREYGANGFKLVEEFDELPWQHLMFFERE
jgi:ubiquinone/menaquinone biosynthesis C-methylase UbiE